MLAPVLDAPPSLLAKEDVPLPVTGLTLDNDDPTADGTEIFTIFLRTNVRVGSRLVVGEAAWAQVGTATGNDTPSVSFSGTVATVNAALSALTYVSAAYYTGLDQLTFEAFEGLSNAGGNPFKTVDITVDPVNNAPIRTSPSASLGTLTVVEDSANVFAVPLFDDITLDYAPAGPGNLLENDQDLTYSITGIPGFLELVTFVQGVGDVPVAVDDVLTLADLQELRYKTVPNKNGAGAVTWRVTDVPTDGTDPESLDQARSVRVGPVNDAPVVDYPGGDPTANRIPLLPNAREDLEPPVQSVESIFLDLFSDPRDDGQGLSTADEFAGVAVSLYTPDPAKGEWQFKDGSTDGVWTALREVPPDTSYVFIRREAQIRFRPGKDYNGAAPDVTVRLADTSGWPEGDFPQSGTTITPPGAGFETPFSEGTLVLWTSVAAEPDAATDIQLVTTPFNNVPLGVTALPGTKVGTLLTIDPDTVDQSTFTYALVAGAGADHNQYFRISGTDPRLLEVRQTPGFYPAGGVFSIRVRSTGADGLGSEKVLTIAARPLAPSAPDLAATSDSGQFDTDDYTNVTTPTFVVDVPNPPDGGVESVRLFVRRPRGTATDFLGLATRNDLGLWEFTVPQASRFTADGIYAVTARVTAAGGGTSDDSTALAVEIDTRGAAITAWSSISSPRTTPVASVTATFDEAVFVPGVAADVKAGGFRLTNTSVVGQLPAALPLGSATLAAEAGSGWKQWTLGNLEGVTAASGRYDLALEVDRSTFTDLAGNDIRERSAIFWNNDASAPTVSLTRTGPALRNEPVATVTARFSENVTGFDAADLRLRLQLPDGTIETIETPEGITIAPLKDPAQDYTISLPKSLQTVDGVYTLELVTTDSVTPIRDDVAGNPGNALQSGAAVSWTIETTAPTAAFREAGTDPGTDIRSPRGQAVQGLVLSFTEPVAGVEATDIVLTRDGNAVPTDGLTLSPLTGTSATFVIGGLGPLTAAAGTYVITLRRDTGTPVADASGNLLEDDVTATWEVDTTAPQVESIAVSPTGGLSNDPVETATVTFGTGFEGVVLIAGNFRLTRNGSFVSLAGATMQDKGNGVFVLEFLGAATGSDGRYVLALRANGIVNDLGNVMVDDAIVEWTTDATVPKVTLDLINRTGSGPATVFTIRALFGEPVNDFDPEMDVDVADGTVTGLAPGGDGTREFRFIVRPDSTLPVEVSIPAAAASDPAGNASEASNALKLVTDFTRPQVTLKFTPVDPDDPETDLSTEEPPPTITNKSPILFIATFTEPVTGLEVGDVVVTNGTVNAVTRVEKDVLSWKITVMPAADGTVTVSFPGNAARDLSDNPSVASNLASVVFDSTRPTVTLTSLSGTVSRAARLQVAARFSEDVTGVDVTDKLTGRPLALNVTGGTVESVTGSGRDYVFVVTPDRDGTVEATFPENAAFDRADNGNTASTLLSIISDRTPPQAWLSGPVGGIVTVTFSEPVRGFDFGDLVLWQGNRTVSLRGASLREVVPGEAWEIDLGAVITLTGDFRLALLAANSGIVDVAAGNRLAADAELLFSNDNQPPVALISVGPRVTPMVRGEAVVTFTEPVTGVDVGDFQLLQNGVPIDLTGVRLSPEDEPAVFYTLVGLDAVASTDATYVLRLVAANSGITDAAGNRLAVDASATWRLDTVAPVAQIGARTGDAIGPLPSPRSTAVTTIDVRFDQRVTGLDLADFSLRRDGVGVRLAGATLAPYGTSGREFRISGLAPLTTFAGSYALELRAGGTGIVDAAGNALADGVTATWVNDGTLLAGVLSAAFTAVTPNPRTEPVSVAGLSFSSGVTGVDAGDFRLTRTSEGATTVLTGFTVVRAGSASRWEVRGLETLTQQPGDYALQLRASGSGIATAAAVPLGSDASVSWTKVVVGEPPRAAITLDAPLSAGAAIDSATIEFTETVTGVGLEGFRLLRNGVALNLTGIVLTGSGRFWQLRGLSPLTAALATYELRLAASRSAIRDLDGNPLAGNATSGQWTQALPTVRAAFLGVKTERAKPLAAAKVRFSVPVKGVDLRDFELRRDGLLIRRLPGVIISGSGDTWTIENLAPLQTGPGSYELTLTTLSNDIVDAQGSPLAERATLNWRIL